MALGDSLGNIDKSELFKQALSSGDVLLKKFDGIDHPKYFIVVGISETKAFICSVYINSRIHPAVKSKQHLLELQIPLKKVNNPFLKYDSFANCSTLIPMKGKNLGEWIADNTCKIIASIFEDDLACIIEKIKNSGLVSEEDIALYFSDEEEKNS